MSKVIITKVEGCYWCPFRKKYEIDKSEEGRCSNFKVRKGNYKLIREDEYKNYEEDGKFKDLYKFPDWCPLDDCYCQETNN